MMIVQQRTTLIALSLLTTALLAGASSALAGGDADAGEAISATCAACHGPDGIGTLPIYPVIAGQYEDYLVHALKAYRDGQRKNIVMGGMAAALSDEDIENLAAYYASLPSPLSVLPDD